MSRDSRIVPIGEKKKIADQPSLTVTNHLNALAPASRPMFPALRCLSQLQPVGLTLAAAFCHLQSSAPTRPTSLFHSQIAGTTSQLHTRSSESSRTGSPDVAEPVKYITELHLGTRATSTALPLSALSAPPTKPSKPTRTHPPTLWIQLESGHTSKHLIDQEIGRFLGVTKVSIGT